MESVYFNLASGIRLRQENFGGLVFNKQTGTTVDVDREAFILLTLLKENDFLSKVEIINALAENDLSVKQESVLSLLTKFTNLGIITKNKALGAEVENREIDNDLKISWPSFQHLRAPETVHWAITYRCEQDCLDCYARRHKNEFTELDTEAAFQVVDKIADWGAFQLAIGGGEPLVRDDLAAITEYAHKQGLVVHLTTGVDDIESKLLTRLAGSVTSLQLGINHQQLITGTQQNRDKLADFVTKIRSAGLEPGAHLMLSRMAINNFERIISYLDKIEFSRLVLLRYKPPADINQWEREKPATAELLEFEKVLAKVVNNYDLNLGVDCALGFLQRRLEVEEALERGVRGCTAGKRIAALTPDAAIFPCSQLIKSDLKAGNLLTDNPDEVWKKSKVIKNYRFYKNKKVFKESRCGICKAADHCSGCRVFSSNGRGADPGCPQPIVGSLKQIGKYGRRAELKEYFKNHSFISVGEYMERYGVGQKRAVKELKGTSWLVQTDKSATGRKQSDYYQERKEDAISAVQDSIGYTSGGVPFATREQVADWIKEEDYRAYPKWLL